MNRRQSFPLVVILLALASCQQPVPQAGLGGAIQGTVRIVVSQGARAVVSDWNTQVTSYKVKLVSQDGHTDLSGLTSSGELLISGVVDGTWDVLVSAYAGELLVGQGSCPDQTLGPMGSASVSVTVEPQQVGTGGYQFQFSLPLSTGVDYVSGQLFRFADGMATGSLLEPELVIEGGSLKGSLSAAAIPSGLYQLALTFRRGGAGGAVAAALGEGVTIWDNVTSDRWLAADGSLQSQRTFSPNDFGSASTKLAALAINSGLTLSPAFSSTITEYAVAAPSLAHLSAILSVDGQSMEYRRGTDDWAPLTSDTSVEVAISTGSVVEIRVTAPDGGKGVYRMTFTRQGITYSSRGATSGEPPMDSVVYSEGANVTVADNTGNLAREGFAFAGWTTATDASGTTFAPGAILSKGTDDVVFYPIWLDNRLTFTLSGNQLAVTGHPQIFQYGSQLVIPIGVTAITDGAFYNCPGLVSIQLPSTLTQIGAQGFTHCSGLVTLTIPDSVTQIGVSAFSGCSGLTSLTLSSSLATIPDQAFQECHSLTSLTIPAGVTSIGWAAFSRSTGLTEVSIPASVTSIGTVSFLGCTGLMSISVDPTNPVFTSVNGVLFDEAVTSLKAVPGGLSGALVIPETVTNLGSGLFAKTGITSVVIPSSLTALPYGCFSGAALTEFTIPAAITTIGSGAFEGCEGLTSVTVPATVTSLDYSAFENCIGLKSVTFQGTLDRLTSSLFAGCVSLETVILPQGLVYLDPSVFSGCTGMTTITLPDSVQSIAESTFEKCSNLGEIVVGPGNTQFDSINGVLFSKSGGTLLRVPGGIAGAYTVPSGTLAIAPLAFGNCAKLTSVELPSTLQAISDRAFSDCTGLTAITLPASLTYLGYLAFYRCLNLATVTSQSTTPPALTADFGSSHSYVFLGCASTLSIQVPAASVTAYQQANYWVDYAPVMVGL